VQAAVLADPPARAIIKTGPRAINRRAHRRSERALERRHPLTLFLPLWYGLNGESIHARQGKRPAMTKRCITAPGAPPPAGPYSHAVECGGFVYLSGQVALKPDGSGLLRGTIEEETRQVFANIQAVLAASGVTLREVVKALVFLDDMDNFAAFNRVYKEFFPEDPPARSCVQVARLPGDVKVEIEVIAKAR
jgi:2-iminobutanoate/2-iminopropanoate deaminase